jgi:hypothetical protein
MVYLGAGLISMIGGAFAYEHGRFGSAVMAVACPSGFLLMLVGLWMVST